MKILIYLLVPLLLALAVDRGAEHVAERVAADSARETLALPGPVDVEVGGFPFLTQLAGGHFDEIRVEAGQVPVGRVTARRLDLTAYSVSADYDQPTATRADQVRLAMLVSYDQVNRVAPEGVRVGPQGPRTVRVTAPLDVPGRRVTSRSAVRVEDGAVLVQARRIWINGTPLADTGLDSRVAGRLDFSVPLDSLPRGVAVTGVRAGPEGVVVRGEVRDLALARLALAGG